MSTQGRRGWKFWTVRILGALVVIQLVPYGRAHTNPPVVKEPAWDTPETRELVRAACFDCHSNETRWPRYSWVAPSSWLTEWDVNTARSHLNFSEFQRPQRHAKDAAEQVRTGEMPQTSYTWFHKSARLSAADRERLAVAFERMFGRQ